MTLRKVAGDCDEGTCPAVHVSDRETLVFQGEAVPAAKGLTLGPGEQAVELPPHLLREALANLAGRFGLPTAPGGV